MRKFKFTTLLLALFLGFTTQAQILQLSVVSQTNLQIMNMSDYDVNSALQAITMQTFKAYKPSPMGVLNECTAVPIISTASNITYTTANLNWVAPEGGSGNYKVQWSDSENFTSVIGEESVSAEQYSISGLTNKTTYYYRVQSVCDNSELSEWSAVESFQTGGYTPIEVTGFNQDVIASGNTPASEATTAKVDADGMAIVAEGYYDGTDNRQRLPLNRVLHNGTHGNAQPTDIKYLLNSYTENNAINLPGGSGTFALVTPEYYENLYLTGFTGNGTASLSIKVVYEDDSEQSFNKSLGDWWGGSTYVIKLNGRINRNNNSYDGSIDNPRFYQITLDGLDQSKAVKEIVIENPSGSSGSRIANIFAVSGIVPPTCPSPSNLLVSNITVNTAQLAWTAPANEPSNGYEWEVILSSDGSVVDNGTTTATSADVSGLNPNNTYKARVKALCDAGDFSDWIESTEFSTPCVAIADFPWTEGFESGNTNNNIIPTLGCWNEELVSGSTKWKFVNQNGNNSISPRTGSLMAEFRVTSSGPTSKLVTPSFDFTNLNIPQLTFYYTNVAWYNDIDELKVYYKKDISDANWTLIPGAEYTSPQTSWEKVEIVLPEADNATSYTIAFEAKSNYAYGVTIDDITIDEAPSCLEPTNLDTEIISISSVNITWTEAITQAESYEWEVRSSGTAGSGAEGLFESGSTEVSITSVEIVNLETDIEYTFYLRSKCSDSDYSTWTSTTFELGYCTPSVNDCYGGEDHLISVELGSLLSEGLTCSPMYEDLSSTQNAIPDISAGTDIELKTNSHEHATVWIDFNQNGIFESSEFTHIGKGNNTTVISVPLDAKLGQTKMRLISKFGGAVGPEDACTYVQFGSSRDYLVNVIVATTCEEPTSIIAENITHNSATINWTASTSEPANGYDIYFASSSDNPAEDATPSATVDAGVTTYDLSGLTAETNYYVWVRSVCDETTNSQWEGPASFTTEEEPTYTLVINATNGTVTGEGSYLENASVTIEATPSTGYDFVNWTDENGEVSTENPYTFTMPANNITLTANFAEENVEPTEYALTLTVDPVDAGTVTGAGNHQAGAEVDITATAAEGYEFVKWTNGEEVVSTDANFTFTMPANDLTLTANFAEETVEPTEYALTLVVDPVDAGTVTGAGNHQAGAEVEITATAAEGYEFVEWTNGEEVVSTDANFTFTMPASDVTLIANFAEENVEPTKYTLTLTISPENAGTVSGGGEYAEGEEVTISTTAVNEDFVFLGWTNGTDTISNDAQFVFTMINDDVTLVAHYRDHTSISENDMSGIQIYPNPSLGIFNVVADKTYDLQIVDMTGRLVLYENITEGTNSVDIQHVQTGVYFVRLISNDDIKTIRIVKN